MTSRQDSAQQQASIEFVLHEMPWALESFSLPDRVLRHAVEIPGMRVKVEDAREKMAVLLAALKTIHEEVKGRSK